MKIAVFVSGNGSNLQALIDAKKTGDLKNGEIVLVVSDKPGAYAVERAEKEGIKTFVLNGKEFAEREKYDEVLAEKVKEENIELIVLAGFMRILSKGFVEKFKNRILNIHPALLPDFKGTHGIKDALEAGVEVTGVTVHFVNAELDAGPIILQKEVKIAKEDTLETLEEKIHKTEHELYPEAVRLFVENKLEIKENIVKINE